MNELLKTLGTYKSWPRNRERLLRELAYIAAKLDGFGGSERALRYEQPKGWYLSSPDSHRSIAGMVVRVRSVQTGLYYPPHHGHDPDDYENGGLEERKTRRLAVVASHEYPFEALQRLKPCAVCDSKMPPDVKARDERLRTVHFIQNDWDEEHPGPCIRCYYCGNEFEEDKS